MARVAILTLFGALCWRPPLGLGRYPNRLYLYLFRNETQIVDSCRNGVSHAWNVSIDVANPSTSTSILLCTRQLHVESVSQQSLEADHYSMVQLRIGIGSLHT